MRSKLKQRIAARLLRTSQWIDQKARALAPPAEREVYEKRLEKWRQLWFIADVPLFIDENAVNRLFDAVLRPQFLVDSRKRTASTTRMNEGAIEGALSVESSIPMFLKGNASVKASTKDVWSDSEGQEYMEDANRSAEYRLEQIVDYYVRVFPTQLLWTSENLATLEDLSGMQVRWAQLTERLTNPSPRPLIVLDLCEGSRLLPMAAESTEGKVAELYKTLRKVLDPDGNTLSTYPKGDHVDQKLVQEYWKSHYDAFDSRKAMEIVEECTKADGKRLDWIDYRLMGRDEHGHIIPLHLHVTPRGLYNTGTFAYQTIRRCFKHGLRMVGTLKQGEDINVLAIYEN